VSASVLYMSMSLDGYIAGPNDEPGHPGGDDFMRWVSAVGRASEPNPYRCVRSNEQDTMTSRAVSPMGAQQHHWLA
jgi:hypothetical protein